MTEQPETLTDEDLEAIESASMEPDDFKKLRAERDALKDLLREYLLNGWAMDWDQRARKATE